MLNPFQMMTNQTMQNQMIQQMKSQNPELFQKVQEMTNGKSDVELRTLANNIAKERGIDLNKFASQFGIQI
jgi:hypothetical protein